MTPVPSADRSRNALTGEERFLQLVEENLAPETDVLDVGCGDGRLALQLAARVRSVVGVDRDQQQIEAAVAHAHERRIANARFVSAKLAGPGEDRPSGPLPLPDRSVDLVFNRRGPILARYVDDMLRVARPGALLLGLHPAGGPPPPAWADELGRLQDVFHPIPADVVASWVTGPLERLRISDYTIEWIDIPESVRSTRELYERLCPSSEPPFSQVEAELDRAFRRGGAGEAIELRQQRLLYRVRLP